MQRTTQQSKTGNITTTTVAGLPEMTVLQVLGDVTDPSTATHVCKLNVASQLSGLPNEIAPESNPVPLSAPCNVSMRWLKAKLCTTRRTDVESPLRTLLCTPLCTMGYGAFIGSPNNKNITDKTKHSQRTASIVDIHCQPIPGTTA